MFFFSRDSLLARDLPRVLVRDPAPSPQLRSSEPNVAAQCAIAAVSESVQNEKSKDSNAADTCESTGPSAGGALVSMGRKSLKVDNRSCSMLSRISAAVANIDLLNFEDANLRGSLTNDSVLEKVGVHSRTDAVAAQFAGGIVSTGGET